LSPASRLKLGTVPSNKVASVTGCELSGFASIGANGAEDGQTYANIIFWDKISQAWPNTTGASMQNTISANPHSTEDTTDIVVTFTEPIEGTLLNNGGPYIWVNNERGREIHPGRKRTHRPGRPLLLRNRIGQLRPQ
jgi:LruC domain-containing protein